MGGKDKHERMSGAHDLCGQAGRGSRMLDLFTPSQEPEVLARKLGAMYSTLARHGLPDAAIRNYLAQQLLIRQHMERIHQLAQHELEMEQAQAKFEAERTRPRLTRCTTDPGPPVSVPAPLSAPSCDDDDAAVRSIATGDTTGTCDTAGETNYGTAARNAPAPHPMAKGEASSTKTVGTDEAAWMIGSNALPCDSGEWLDSMGDDLWSNDDATSTFDLDRSTQMSVHRLCPAQISIPHPEQADDSTPCSDVGDVPTSPRTEGIESGTQGFHPGERLGPKRPKLDAQGAGSRRMPGSSTIIGLADLGVERSETAVELPSQSVLHQTGNFSPTSSTLRQQNLHAAVRVAGTPPDSDALRQSTTAAPATAAAPLNDIHAILQAATVRMLAWQEAAVVLKYCIREHNSGGSGRLLGPRPDVVISANPSEQPGALYVEMPKVPRKAVRLKHQKSALVRWNEDAECPTMMLDRWRNSGGGKGSSDLPRGAPKPTVRRRYGAVVPANPTPGHGSNQHKLKRENSLRYYEYTLLDHTADGAVGEHECYLFHVIHAGVPRAANS